MSSAWETDASSHLAGSQPTCFLIRCGKTADKLLINQRVDQVGARLRQTSRGTAVPDGTPAILRGMPDHEHRAWQQPSRTAEATLIAGFSAVLQKGRRPPGPV